MTNDGAFYHSSLGSVHIWSTYSRGEGSSWKSQNVWSLNLVLMWTRGKRVKKFPKFCKHQIWKPHSGCFSIESNRLKGWWGALEWRSVTVTCVTWCVAYVIKPILLSDCVDSTSFVARPFLRTVVHREQGKNLSCARDLVALRCLGGSSSPECTTAPATPCIALNRESELIHWLHLPFPWWTKKHTHSKGGYMRYPKRLPKIGQNHLPEK